MKSSKLFLIALFVLFVGVNVSVAQQIDTKNGVEYNESTNGIEDLNSISLSSKPIKKNRVIKAQKEETPLSVEDLERIVSKRRTLRYRKNRNITEKCYKEAEEGACDSDKEKHNKKKIN